MTACVPKPLREGQRDSNLSAGEPVEKNCSGSKCHTLGSTAPVITANHNSETARTYETLTKFCRDGTEVLGADLGVVVLSGLGSGALSVVAKYPESDSLDIEMIHLIYGVAVERLDYERGPLIIHDVATSPILESVRGALLKHDVRAFLVVPLLSEGRILGLYLLVNRYPLTIERIAVELCQGFAARSFVAVNHLLLLTENERQRQRAQLLLEISNIFTHPKSLDLSLQRFAELMLSVLPHSFCQIALLNEDGTSLTIRAAHAAVGPEGNLNWDSNLGTVLPALTWPGLEADPEGVKPVLLRFSDERGQGNLGNLARYSKQLRLKPEQSIRSLLIVPLTIWSKFFGLIYVGEVWDKPQGSFSREQVDLASAIAVQAAIFLDRTIMKSKLVDLEELLKIAIHQTDTEKQQIAA